MFSSLDEKVIGYGDIIFCDNIWGRVEGIDKIAISNDNSLTNVLLIDSLQYNFLSVTQICDFGYKCTFTKDDVEVTSLDGNNQIFKGFRHENVYLVDFSSSDANLSQSKESEKWQ